MPGPVRNRQTEQLNSMARVAVGTGAVEVLASTPGRARVQIQNAGTTIIYLGFGASNATPTVYVAALAACTTADDGTGGVLIEEMWTGRVSAVGSGAGGAIVVTELLGDR